MTQLPLPIAWSAQDTTGPLLIHSGNAEAVGLLRGWPNWGAPCLLLKGPRRSGRSLLARLFETEIGGIAIDDAQRADETRLFNLWNAARDHGPPLLLVIEDTEAPWTVSLPDLHTRVGTAAIARIAAPDEAGVAALIAHGLERAGSAFAPDVPDFLARRLPRCYETIDGVVARLNAASLASGHKLIIASVRALAGLADTDMTAATTSDKGIQQRG